MKYTKSSFFVLCGCAAAFVLASCAMGLDPAKNSDGTVVSLRLGGAASRAASAIDSRAVFSGDGYLYIRLGGVSSGGQRVFGPYAIKAGETFSTTDIPAGDYRFVALLYSSEPLDGLLFNSTHLVSDALNYDDAAFEALKSDSTFSDAFTEATCGTFVYNVTIKEGQTNELAATLDPLTPWSPVFDGTSGWSVCSVPAAADTSKLMRRFIRIEGINTAINGVTDARVSVRTDTSIQVVTVRCYNSAGKSIDAGVSTGTIAASSPIVNFDDTGDNTDYVYVEYYATESFGIQPQVMLP